MIYKAIDGFTFEAADAQECIVKLRADSWNPEPSLEGYAQALARRAKLQTGKTIPATPYDELVAGLISAGLLEVVTSYERLVSELINSGLLEVPNK